MNVLARWNSFPMPKRKIFVSYHHGGDRYFYESFSRTFCYQYDVLDDNSPERAISSDDVDYVRWRLSNAHITGSSCTIVLVGCQTWGRKYVDWEIDATLEKEHGLIAVMLPTGVGTVPDRLGDNIQTGYAPSYWWAQVMANAAFLKHAIEHAINKPAWRINNTRERRYRNAPLFVEGLLPRMTSA
jgi:Thoeris protein ThsB, TIR-like domain